MIMRMFPCVVLGLIAHAAEVGMWAETESARTGDRVQIRWQAPARESGCQMESSGLPRELRVATKGRMSLRMEAHHDLTARIRCAGGWTAAVRVRNVDRAER